MESTNVLPTNTFAEKRKAQLDAEKVKDNICRMLSFCATWVGNADNEETCQDLAACTVKITSFYLQHEEPFPRKLWMAPLAKEVLRFAFYDISLKTKYTTNALMQRLVVAAKKTPALAVASFLNEFERVTGVPFGSLFGEQRDLDRELLMTKRKGHFEEDEPEMD